jgi:hypothetical protein
MSNTLIPNLWGDLPPADAILAPLSILRHQAGLLSDMTQGMLIGEVKTTTGEQISHVLIVRVPAMGNYSIKLVYASHGPTLYPVEMFNPQDSILFRCDDESSFKAKLGDILTSSSSKKLIQGLLTAAKASAST